MKVWVVGTGPWGRVLAREATALGHDVEIRGRSEIREGRPDAALIAVPPFAQAAFAYWFLEDRVPVWLEKPVALKVAEARAIRDYAKHHDTRVAVDFCRLLAPSWQAWKRGGPQGHVAVSVGGLTPTRNWPVADPVLWDYGPHAAAYLLDLGVDPGNVRRVERDPSTTVVDFDNATLRVSNRRASKQAFVVRTGEADGEADVYAYNADAERPLRDALDRFFRGDVPPELSIDMGVRVTELLAKVL